MKARLSILLAVMLIALCIPAQAAQPGVEYLSDVRGRIVHTGQAWGVLGIDTCAHAGQTPLPMQIGGKVYKKGLGHHASGEIVIDLEGLYDRFEAEVGVQKQASNTGSVVFQVFVDDEERFDSGVMRESDAPKPVSIPLDGAAELRLVALDAGDGISCDCANWAEARLTLSANPKPVAAREFADVAPFARVVTFDPARMEGSRANRVQEFHVDDLFLDTDLTPNDDDVYEVQPQDGRACIGLQWIERRILREVGIEFSDAVPSSEGVQVQAWAGESPWQGGWRPINGKITRDGNVLRLKIDRAANPETGGTWKIRWIWPSDKPSSVKRLTAFTGARWSTVDIRLEADPEVALERGSVDVYNGEIVGEPDGVGWEWSKPISMKVRYLRPRSWESDRSVLRISIINHCYSIAIDDLIANKAVLVGGCLFAAVEPDGPSLAEYRKQIEGRKTIRQQVREMPDQTFEQAMAKTHNPIQDNGPTMLSLACDNHKFVVEQDGSIRFAPPGAESNPAGGDLREMMCLMRPRIKANGPGRADTVSQPGWLPALGRVFRDGKVTYYMGFLVTDLDESASSKAWPYINRKPLLTADFEVSNSAKEPADIRMSLDFIADVASGLVAELKAEGSRTVVYAGEKPIAAIMAYQGGAPVPVPVRIDGGSLVLEGALPADHGVRYRVFIPGWEFQPNELPGQHLWSMLDQNWVDHWLKALEPAMQVAVPDDLLQQTIRASQIHCLIAARNEEDGKRIAPWIASDRYGPLESEANSIIRGMMLMGHEDFARRSLDFFIKRYSPEGFLTTGYTLMGTGWHLQTLGEYFDLTQDKKWMASVAPDVERVCKWITAQRAKTIERGGHWFDRMEYGLMPPGVQADWNAFAYHFALNGYYCAGLREASEALDAIGRPSAKDLLREARMFSSDLCRAFSAAAGMTPAVPLRNGQWAIGYPGQLHAPGPTGSFFPGEDGNRSWCYDVELGAHHLVTQGVLDPRGLEVAGMLDHMEDVQFLADGWFDYPAEKNKADWFNLGGFSKVQPYYTRNAEIYAMTDDVKPFIRSYFNALASLLCTENLTLWEHFHNAGAWNKTHETGYFLQQTRWMLVQERGNELWLAPFVTDRWLEDGKEIRVDNALTRFGRCGYRIESRVGEGFIRATIDPPTERAPETIALRLRHPGGKSPRSVSVTGIPAARFDAAKSAVMIPGPFKGSLDVRVEY